MDNANDYVMDNADARMVMGGLHTYICPKCGFECEGYDDFSTFAYQDSKHKFATGPLCWRCLFAWIAQQNFPKMEKVDNGDLD